MKAAEENKKQDLTLNDWTAQAAFFEQQHWQSCGRQSDSKRKTNPCFSFGVKEDGRQREGLTATGRIRDDVRCDAILVPPTSANPGPKYNLPRPETFPSTVTAGFGSARRFETKAEAPPTEVYELGGELGLRGFPKPSVSFNAATRAGDKVRREPNTTFASQCVCSYTVTAHNVCIRARGAVWRHNAQ